MEQGKKVSDKKVIKARVFNIVQNEYNPKTGEDLHFNEENIKNCIGHKTIKEWCYIRHDKDTYTKDDKERHGRARELIYDRNTLLFLPLFVALNRCYLNVLSAVRSGKLCGNVDNSYIIPILLLYRYSYTSRKAERNE